MTIVPCILVRMESMGHLQRKLNLPYVAPSVKISNYNAYLATYDNIPEIPRSRWFRPVTAYFELSTRIPPAKATRPFLGF